MHPFSRAILAAAIVLTAGGTAIAKPAHQKQEPRGGADAGVSVDVSIVLGERERDIVRSHYASNCPPGLAKKRNGCLPPGQAKKRYAVGGRVPDGVEIVVLPEEVIVRLPPLPRGYGYRVVDGDLVVVALATLIIADAIGLL